MQVADKVQHFFTEKFNLISSKERYKREDHHYNTTVIIAAGKILQWMLKSVCKSLRRNRISKYLFQNK